MSFVGGGRVDKFAHILTAHSQEVDTVIIVYTLGDTCAVDIVPVLAAEA